MTPEMMDRLVELLTLSERVAEDYPQCPMVIKLTGMVKETIYLWIRDRHEKGH